MTKTTKTTKKNIKPTFVSKDFINLHGKMLIKTKCVPEKLRDDKEVVMKSLEVDKSYFLCISDRLRDDIDVATKAMNIEPYYYFILR